jgi:hypothetical protein
LFFGLGRRLIGVVVQKCNRQAFAAKCDLVGGRLENSFGYWQ